MNIKEFYEDIKKEGCHSCGPGWKKLILDLCEKIIQIDDSIYVLCVKEKYGSLRFYVGGATDEISSLIDKAEAESYYICENCGIKSIDAGVITLPVNGWTRTLCQECRENVLRRKKDGRVDRRT